MAVGAWTRVAGQDRWQAKSTVDGHVFIEVAVDAQGAIAGTVDIPLARQAEYNGLPDGVTLDRDDVVAGLVQTLGE